MIVSFWLRKKRSLQRDVSGTTAGDPRQTVTRAPPRDIGHSAIITRPRDWSVEMRFGRSFLEGSETEILLELADPGENISLASDHLRPVMNNFSTPS